MRAALMAWRLRAVLDGGSGGTSPNGRDAKGVRTRQAEAIEAQRCRCQVNSFVECNVRDQLLDVERTTRPSGFAKGSRYAARWVYDWVKGCQPLLESMRPTIGRARSAGRVFEPVVQGAVTGFCTPTVRLRGADGEQSSRRAVADAIERPPATRRERANCRPYSYCSRGVPCRPCSRRAVRYYRTIHVTGPKP